MHARFQASLRRSALLLALLSLELAYACSRRPDSDPPPRANSEPRLANLLSGQVVRIEADFSGCFNSASYAFEISGGDPMHVRAEYSDLYETRGEARVPRASIARFDATLDAYRQATPPDWQFSTMLEITWLDSTETIHAGALMPAETAAEPTIPTFQELARLGGIRFWSDTERWIHTLATSEAHWRELYERHYSDNDPHWPQTFMGALAQVLEERVQTAGISTEDARLLKLLGRLSASDEFAALLSASFLPNVNWQSMAGRKLRGALGTRLRRLLE